MKLNLNAPLPKDPVALVRVYREANKLRLAMQKEVDAVAKYEREAKAALIATIPKSGDGIVADDYAVRVTTSVKPTIKDWNALVAAVQQSGRFDLLQKRLSDKAVQDMWEAGIEVPGVERFNHVDLSITKLR